MKARRRPAQHWLLLAGLVVMWGTSFLWIKVAHRSFSPEFIVAGRLGLAALVLLVLLRVTGRRLPTLPRQGLDLAVMAVVGNALPFWLISWGQQRIDSGLSGILMAVMPLTTVLLAHFLLDAFSGEESLALREFHRVWELTDERVCADGPGSLTALQIRSELKELSEAAERALRHLSDGPS